MKNLADYQAVTTVFIGRMFYLDRRMTTWFPILMMTRMHLWMMMTWMKGQYTNAVKARTMVAFCSQCSTVNRQRVQARYHRNDWQSGLQFIDNPTVTDNISLSEVS